VLGVVFGVLGLGFGPHPPNPKSPIPNPQSPIPKYSDIYFIILIFIFKFLIIKIKSYLNKWIKI